MRRPILLAVVGLCTSLLFPACEDPKPKRARAVVDLSAATATTPSTAEPTALTFPDTGAPPVTSTPKAVSTSRPAAVTTTATTAEPTAGRAKAAAVAEPTATTSFGAADAVRGPGLYVMNTDGSSLRRLVAGAANYP